jgi:sulfoxide reductase catalytic subunit YedY
VVKHNCIQGWSAVAEWSGVPMAAFIERCRPLPGARYLVFNAYDDKGNTEPRDGSGYYYETPDMRLARAPQTILVHAMNGRPLPVEHKAPLRLRVEGQLGFKMVKWIRTVEFVDDFRKVGQGQEGSREDNLYYSHLAGI